MRLPAATLVLALLFAPAAGRADGPTPISDCTDTTGLRAAVAAGGSYVFTCSGTLAFSFGESEITVAKPVTLDAAQESVHISGSSGRLFDVVDGGSLTLTRDPNGGFFGLDSGNVTAPGSAFGVAGTNGAPGTDATDFGESGGTGGNGTPGTDAKNAAADDPAAKGGCIYIAAHATVSLTRVGLSDCSAGGAFGGQGGDGGNGGNGGVAGNGGVDGVPGVGGNGGRGADGGNGGNGGDAYGGAIYNAGALTLDHVTLTFNAAVGGQGGSGGRGGSGGSGGNGGGVALNGPGNNGSGGGGGGAGSAGRGGSSGSGYGGAIYSSGTLSVVASSFDHNEARGGGFGFQAGGAGGKGGDGGGGGGKFNLPDQPPGGDGGAGGNGGHGGNGGDTGSAAGGAIFSSDSAVDDQTTFTDNAATPGTYPGGSAHGAGDGGAKGGGGPGGYGGSNGLDPGARGADGIPGSAGIAGRDGTASDPNVHVFSLLPRFTWEDESCHVCSTSERYALDATSTKSNVGVASWSWSFDDGMTDTTGPNVTHSFPDAGAHHVVLTVTDQQGHVASVAADIKPCSGNTDTARRRRADTASCPLIVNDARDLPDPDTTATVCDIDPATAGKQCTLRAALQVASARGTAQAITFDGVPSIAVGTVPLPAAAVPVTIDGGGVVTLDGGHNLIDGLTLTAGQSTVRGLTITNFGGNGVLVMKGAGDTISGDQLTANGRGIRVQDAPTTTIDHDVVTLNGQEGVQVISTNDDLTGTMITSNHIGVTSALAPAGNGGDGVKVEHAAGVTIGGTLDQGANVISANGGNGVELIESVTGATIAGNFIGGDPQAGPLTTALGNGGAGIYDHRGIGYEGNNLIGGSDPGTGNVVNDNKDDGIWLQTTQKDVVLNNIVGLTRDLGEGGQPGEAEPIVALSNERNGIQVTDALQNTIRGNHIGRQFFSAIFVDTGANLNTIEANTLNRGSTGVQLFADAHDNTISHNTIRGMSQAAVRAVGAGTIANRITENSMASDNYGIDLVNDEATKFGVVPYDLERTRTGANHLQQFPVLGGSRGAGNGIGLDIAVIDLPGKYRLEVFADTTCNASGYGEGEQLLLAKDLTFTSPVTLQDVYVPTHAGQVLTATLTNAEGDTSEFSNCVTAGEEALTDETQSLLSRGVAQAAGVLAKLRLAGLAGGPTVQAPAFGPGTLGAALTGTTSHSGALAAKRLTLARVRKTVKKAGVHKLRLKPTKTGKRLLRKAKRAKLTLTLSFTPKKTKKHPKPKTTRAAQSFAVNRR